MPTSLCVGEGRACPVVNVSTQSHLHLVHADGLAMRVQGEESVEGLDVVVHIIHIKEGDRPSCAASQLKVIVRIKGDAKALSGERGISSTSLMVGFGPSALLLLNSSLKVDSMVSFNRLRRVYRVFF